MHKLVGVVIKKLDIKSVLVITKVIKYNSLYKKTYTKHKKYLVHDEFHIAEENFTILCIQSAPKSKHKHWKVKNILSINYD